MIKRILNFNKQDWKHMSFLFGTLITNFFKCDYHEMLESYYLLKLHLSYDSQIKEN